MVVARAINTGQNKPIMTMKILLSMLSILFITHGSNVLAHPGGHFTTISDDQAMAIGAAAAEQLAGWGGRAGCEVFSKPAGSNPSGVIYEAVEKAVREGFDLVLCDTAGRLHTKTNLMEELKKIKRVIAKVVPAAPHETYLVLDANNGQNAIVQTREFHKAIGVTGLIVTKLDGTARGGVVLGIVNEFELPVRYIGVGEGVDDLRPFDAEAFADSLFD